MGPLSHCSAVSPWGDEEGDRPAEGGVSEAEHTAVGRAEPVAAAVAVVEVGAGGDPGPVRGYRHGEAEQVAFCAGDVGTDLGPGCLLYTSDAADE